MTKITQASWQTQLGKLWPCLKGSLAKVYKPCIRKNCPACLCGDKHPAWLLAYTYRGKRHSRYVPLAMVPTIQKALRNGRRLEQLLYALGPAMLEEHRCATSASHKHPPKS